MQCMQSTILFYHLCPSVCQSNEWLIKAVMAMYEGAQAVVRTTEGDSKTFNVKVGLHQGSVLSPLLFVIVMEMISR